MSTHEYTDGRIGITTILAGTLFAAAALPASATAGPVDDAWRNCPASGSSADARERSCQLFVEEFEDAYNDCMLDAPGTADSLERWVDHCSTEAELATD